MNRKTIALMSITILGVAIASGLSALFFWSQENVDSRLQNLMHKGNVPSLAAGIIVNDTLVWSKGYGEQSDLDTVYMVGSVSKVFTATAVMQLYEKGLVDLDKDINDYIPFSVRDPRFPNTSITVRMLLTHSSGLATDVSDQTLWDLDADSLKWYNDNLGTNFTIWNPRPSLGDFLDGSLNPSGAYYSADNWVWGPRTKWYSNTGFLLLSYIIEQITNQPLPEYVQENVLAPLDMQSTGYDYSDFAGRNAVPYEFRDNAIFEYPLYNLYNFGAAGLRGTVADLSNFLIAHMNEGGYKGSQILQPQTVDLMQTSQFTFVDQGLGWQLSPDSTIWHSGRVVGYLADIAFKTVGNDKVGIVIMLNRGEVLVEDKYLVDSVFPAMAGFLFDEAARLAST